MKRGVTMNGTIVSQFLLSIAVYALPYSIPAVLASEITSETEVIEDEDSDQATAATPAIARFGPFSVINATVVEMRGVIDSATPGDFRRMRILYPALHTLEMVDCPGSEDDEAALALDRLVHQAGINTHVPAHGSIRSGAVELFLAGAHRTADPGAELGVHSWQDDEGKQARDYPPDAPVHAEYINYYVAMGFAPKLAQDFYAFTNAAAPATGIHYMTPDEISRFHIVN
jgi:hypothetical protein